jgi:hypothetical protein
MVFCAVTVERDQSGAVASHQDVGRVPPQRHRPDLCAAGEVQRDRRVISRIGDEQRLAVV